MAAELVIAPDAEQDLTDAYDWYEAQRVGLGEDFLARVDASIEAMLRFPEMHPKAKGDYRRALVRRYPYAIFYEYAGGVVTIYCIAHTSRDPGKWRRRLP